MSMKMLKENLYLKYGVYATIGVGCVLVALLFVSSNQNVTKSQSLSRNLVELEIVRGLVQELQQEGQFTLIDREGFGQRIQSVSEKHQELYDTKKRLSDKTGATIVTEVALMKVADELISLRKTLEERNYKQKAQVQNFITKIQSSAIRVARENDVEFLELFENDLSDFLGQALLRPIRSDYKERIVIHIEAVTDMISAMENKGKIVLSSDEKMSLSRELLKIEKKILQSAVELSNQKVTSLRLSSMIDLSQGAFTLLLLFTIGVFATRQTGRILIGYTMLKKRFRGDLKIVSRQKRINKVLACSELDYRAIVKSNGKIVWATEGFKKLFSFDKLTKNCWNNVLEKQMISIDEVTGIEKSYKLLVGMKKDVMVSIEDIHSFHDIKLVSIKPVTEYYADFPKTKNLTKNPITNYCIVDDVIDKVLASRAEEVSLLDLMVESHYELPRVFKGTELVISSALNMLVDMLSSIKKEQVLKGNLVLSYMIDKEQVILGLDLKKTILTQSNLSKPVKIGLSEFEGLAHYLKKIEEKYVNNECSVLLKNISFESSNGTHEKYSRIEVSLSSNEASLRLKDKQTKSAIRSNSTNQTVDM